MPHSNTTSIVKKNIPTAAKVAMPKATTIILGVDPGTVVMGYALLQCTGNQLKMLHMDVLKLSTKKDVYQRLELIHACINEVIIKHKPTIFAIEAPFFGKNVQSMLKLGRAQGVAIAVAMTHGLEVTEYSPKKVKQSITGNGNADKDQVWRMLQTILHLDEKPQYYDATDALAVALCHHYQLTSPMVKLAGKKMNGWDDFLKANPGRAT